MHCLSARSNGAGVMAKPAVRWASNSKTQLLNQQNIRESGFPLTLSVAGRIWSGSNGWRITVSGAAAAATGRASGFSASTASAFHYSKSANHYADLGLLKTNYRLLVFSSPGCKIQYALHMSSKIDTAKSIPSVSSTYEAGPEVDKRVVVEAIQKWNIFQKQNSKEHDDNADIYGEFGNLDSSKVFPKGITKGNGLYYETRDTNTKEKTSFEEKHHVYICEAEVQMHQPLIPLWAKREVYFQSFVTDGTYIVHECGGEAEMEIIPTHMVKPRTKYLVLACNHAQASKSQEERVCGHDDNSQLLCPRLEVSENSKLKLNGGCGSVHSMNESSIELHHGRESKWNSLWNDMSNN